MREEQPRDRRESEPASNLPAQPTPLLGRDREVAPRGRLVRDEGVRLLTFTGPAGVGKTRLALAAAAAWSGIPARRLVRRSRADHRPGARRRRDRPGARLSRATGEPPGGAPAAARCATAGALLVLDNFEQVLGPAAGRRGPAGGVPAAHGAGDQPRAAAPARRARVPGAAARAARPTPTCRRPTALAGVPAVALFVERPRAVRPDFVLTDENARRPSPRSAAASTACRSPSSWRRRAAGCFPPAALLGAAGAAAAAAHRRRRATSRPASRPCARRSPGATTCSPPEEQALFRRLAVFAGGGDLEMVAPVCAPPGDLQRPSKT